MRRLRVLDGEDGGMVVLVGVLMAVLLICVAIVVDSGRVYHERHLLQNGADAASLAVAFDCARDAAICEGTAVDVGQSYLNANAPDGLSALDPSSPFPANPHIDLTAQTVTVDALSLEPGQATDDGAVTLSLERSDGTQTAQVRARAVAKWGPAALAQGDLPLAISFCEWKTYFEAQGNQLYSEAQAATMGPGHTILFHHVDDDPICPAHIPGFDADEDGFMPGGFGWLISDDCQFVINEIDENNPEQFWVPREPGNASPSGTACLEVGRAYNIPVFIDFRRATPRDEYLLYSPAAFYVTGYRVHPGPSVNPPCRGSDTCISGHFVMKAVVHGQFGSGPGLGINTAKIIE